MSRGYGYELTGADVFAAHGFAKDIGKALGKEKEVEKALREIVEGDKDGFLKKILGRYLE